MKQGANRLKGPQEAKISGKQMNLQQRMKMKTTQSLQASLSHRQLHRPQQTKSDSVLILPSPLHWAIFLSPQAHFLLLYWDSSSKAQSLCAPAASSDFPPSNHQNFLNCHFHLITPGVKNLLLARSLPNSYKLLNSISQVKADSLYKNVPLC